MNKLGMPADEMVEKGMTPQAREAYRERMAKWRDAQNDPHAEEKKS